MYNWIVKKLVSVLFIFIFSSSLLSSIFGPVKADLVNPEYYSKKCNPGEIEVKCSYNSEDPFGPTTYDGCLDYKNNPNYRYLVGEGHSFGGKSIYCFKPQNSTQFISSIFSKTAPQLLGTLLIELSIFVLVGFRRKTDILFVSLANILSVLGFTAIGLTTQLGFIQILIAELLVIVFEVFFILKTTHRSLGSVVGATVTANILSATLGTILLVNLSRLFSG